MKALLLKDWYLSLRYCRAFFLIVAVFLAVAFFSADNFFFFTYPVMIAGILPMTLLSYDERDHWTQYSGTLPFTRAELVSCKYLIGLCFFGITFLATLTAVGIQMAVSGNFSFSDLFSVAVVLFTLGLLGPSILLPFVFRFGVEKGRIAFYITIGMICAVGTVLAGLGFQTVFPSDKSEFLWLMGFAAAAVYLISWRLSIRFYRKREL